MKQGQNSPKRFKWVRKVKYLSFLSCCVSISICEVLMTVWQPDF